MISKIELVECDACTTSGGCVNTCMKAAPVVERHPVGCRYRKTDRPGRAWTYREGVAATPWKGWEVEPLYTSPPELAELQAKYDQLVSDAWAACGGNGPANREDLLTALRLMDEAEEEMQSTIAHLTAEIERLKSESFEELYNAVIDERDALAERLKGGQGEAVAWLNVATGNVTTCPVVVMDWDDEKERVQSLYTSRPAPVSVALPNQVEPWEGMNARDLDSMKSWNACLDKVKELNQ